MVEKMSKQENGKNGSSASVNEDLLNGNEQKPINGQNNEKDHDEDGVHLKRELGLFNSVNLIVGCIIGSGIFLSPKSVVEHSGSVGLSLLVWAFSGVFSLIGALCFAELGTTIPKSGGEYSYLKQAFGDFPAFLLLWVTLLIINPTGQTITALTFAQYVIEPFFPDCPLPWDAVKILTVLCLTLLAYVNSYSVPLATKVQDIFSVAKVLALIAVIFTGFIYFFKGETNNFENSFENSTPQGLALAFYGGLFSYAGWNYLNYLTEEIKNPHRNLPLAIMIAMPIITIIYIFANIAYFAVLSPQELESSTAVALTFANKAYGPVSWIMPLAVALSTFGGVNGGYLSLTRLFYVGAREGQLPEFMAMIQVNRRTPLPSLVFTAILASMYVFVDRIETLLNYFSFMTWLAIGLAVVGQIYLRITKPDLHRPIKFPLALPIIFVIMCVFLVVMGTVAAPMDTIVGLFITATGVPAYFLFVWWKRKPDFVLRWIGKFTHFTQKLFIMVGDTNSEFEKKINHVKADNKVI